MSELIAAAATAQALSAIGIIRLSGDGAIEAADRVFRPFLGEPMCRRRDRLLVYGSLLDAEGKVIDLCLCTVSRAPNSYTGEDTAELQCHGSPTVIRQGLLSLFAAGARQAEAGEFTKRAFLNGRLDLTQAEAVIDLINAETAECARNAAGQLGGAVSRRTDAVYEMLRDMAAHYHAVLDYPDEDIEDFLLRDYEASLAKAASELEALLGTFERGEIMTSGVPAALIGLPNAGKSSLLNAILGYDRAIVTDVPGTTRDTIEERVRLGGVTLRLTDTAGIRDCSDEVERLGVERSRAAARRAKLILAVVDGSQPLGASEKEIIALAESAPKSLIVLTKSDLGTAFELGGAVRVSCVTGDGLSELDSRVRGLFPSDGCAGGEILTNARQAEAVSRALCSLRAAKQAMREGFTPDAVLNEVELSMSALGELSGKTVREDVTNRIFERFCVGK